MGHDSLIGGGERYATELAKAMSKLTPTRLVSFGKATRKEQWDNLEAHIFRAAYHVGGVEWNPLALNFLRALTDADVVHCHQFHLLPTTLSILYSHWRTKPVFVTDLGGGAWDLSYHFHTERWVRAFLHISEFSARAEGFYSGKNRVIGGGVDTELFQPKPVPRQRQVLFVGRIRPAKGLHVLLQAMSPSVPLHVVGPIADTEYFHQLKQISAAKSVAFFPSCSDADLSEHYSRAWVTVLPSLPGTELLGLALLESMACETPVICSRVGGMPETVEEGVTGFVVPPNDPFALQEKICWLFDHPETAREMGRHARQRVLERFTWEAVARRCLEAYSTLN
jgi:glycosyltransferase involved in cell wall biosynthesis